jgi:hypothetical protein
MEGPLNLSQEHGLFSIKLPYLKLSDQEMVLDIFVFEHNFYFFRLLVKVKLAHSLETIFQNPFRDMFVCNYGISLFLFPVLDRLFEGLKDLSSPLLLHVPYSLNFDLMSIISLNPTVEVLFKEVPLMTEMDLIFDN